MKRKIKASLRILFTVMLVTGITSCFKDTNNEEEELKIIANYLKENGLDNEPTQSGLYYIEVIEGTGMQPVAGDTVDVYYLGYFLSGSIFDTNMNSDPFRFTVGAGTVIPGFDEGVTYMKEGGEALLVIPSSLAYGSVGTYGIPGYTPLAYEIILDKVIPGPYH